MVSSISSQLDQLCECRTDRGVRYRIKTRIDDVFAQRVIGVGPDIIELTITKSSRLRGFAIFVQGYVNGEMESFTTSIATGYDGAIRWASTAQRVGPQNPRPNPAEDVTALCATDDPLSSEYNSLLEALVEAAQSRSIRLKDPYGRD